MTATDASGFVARLACPACAFPIGIRAADRKKARVSCPVCGAHAAVTVEAPASDGPFREGAETMALVPATRPADESTIALTTIAPPVFAVERRSRYERIADVASLAAIGAALGGVLAGVAFLPAVGALVALGAARLARRRAETGRVNGAELVNARETPWPRTDRILLPGATIRTEPQADPAEHVVIVERGESVLVVGSIVPLTAEQAKTIAQDLRAAVERLEE